MCSDGQHYIRKKIQLAPIQVKYKVETIIVFLPSLSARIDNNINPVTLPINSEEITESLIYLSSQYKPMCAVIVSGKSMEH